MSYYIVGHDELRRYAEQLLIKLEVNIEDAKIIANSLVDANLRGTDSHGVVRLPMYYVSRIKKGQISKTSKYEIINKKVSVATLDADNGWGQIASLKAMKYATKIAKDTGVCFVGIKNSSHFGIASYYSIAALKEDMIGISLSNAGPDVAPFGAIRSYIGTNPFSIAFPAGKNYPIVLDMATSVMARGKILLGAKRGKKVPYGIAVDKDGKITTDPDKIMTLLAFGGAKGSGIGIAIDILCGILMNSAFGMHVNKVDKAKTDEQLSHLIGAINISCFTDINDFKRNIDQMIDEIKSLPRKRGVKEIFLPGEIELRTKEERMRNGIPISDNIFKELQGLEGCYIDNFIVS
jgi:LDH2 family malate/lactate/ureidoglycolate dehydrogenase